MGWREEAEARLPRKPAHEPASLRADILDELADHLAEALDRERCVGTVPDEVAWPRALSHFGDPARIALQLWWQHMGEKVMQEWIKTALLGVLAVSVLVMAAAMFRQSQQTTAALTALAGKFGQDGPPNPYRLVEFQATRGNTNEPAEGVEVSLTGSLFGTEPTNILGKTDDSGNLTFGPIHTGKFNVEVSDEALSLDRNIELTLFPDATPKTLPLILPEPNPVSIEIQFDVPLHGQVQYIILLSCRHGKGEDVWDRTYQLVVDDRGVGLLIVALDQIRYSSSADPGGHRSAALALLDATPTVPSEPVRPGGAPGNAKRIEFPAATEVEIHSVAIHAQAYREYQNIGQGGLGRHTYPVQSGAENKLVYEFGHAKDKVLELVTSANGEAPSAPNP